MSHTRNLYNLSCRHGRTISEFSGISRLRLNHKCSLLLKWKHYTTEISDIHTSLSHLYFQRYCCSSVKSFALIKICLDNLRYVYMNFFPEQATLYLIKTGHVAWQLCHGMLKSYPFDSLGSGAPPYIFLLLNRTVRHHIKWGIVMGKWIFKYLGECSDSSQERSQQLINWVNMARVWTNCSIILKILSNNWFDLL